MILIKDNQFIRGHCPMTKEDIRALTIWKMNLKDNGRVLDVGSGTGTITVQASKFMPYGTVYSIERDELAYGITEQNLEKFNCKNVVLEKGDASLVLKRYLEGGMSFDSIFIGGTGGNLEKIILQCNQLINSDGTIVMNFITLDNAYKSIEILNKLNYEVDVSLVNISKNRKGSYMMIANNPIYIVQCIKGDN